MCNYGSRNWRIAIPPSKDRLIQVILRQVEHWLNGAKVAEFNMALNDWSERIAGSKFAPYPSFGQISDGHIALQDHGNQVWYRNARIREL